MSIHSSIALPKLRLSPKKVISPQIYDFLRKHITETTIKPGTLLSENSLSEHFCVSRQPVREALMRLSYEGLLSVLPQRGSIVEKISVSQLEQTVFIRLAIEKECILVFPKLSNRDQHAQLHQLERNLKQQREVIMRPEDDDIKSIYLKLDDAFHERLCAFSGSTLAWQTIQGLKGQMDRIRYLTCNTVSPSAITTHEHEQIFEMLVEKRIDECVEMLTEHLTQINHTYKDIINEYGDWFTTEPTGRAI